MQRKKNIRTLGLLFVLLLLLVGCKKETIVPKEEATATQEIQTYHKAAKTDEGKLSLDSTIMSVGNVKVSYKEALIYIYHLKEQYEPSLSGDIWSYEIEENKTFEEYAKEEVISEITQLKVITQKAQELGIVLENDEKDEVNKLAKEYINGIDPADINKYGFTEELIAQIYADNQLAAKVFDIVTNKVDSDISDEEAKQITIQYLMVMTEGEDKNGRKVSMSEDEKATARKRAVNFLKEAKEAENFYNFAESNTDDTTVEVTFGKEDMPIEFGKEAFLLKTGEFSRLLQTESGFYILYCVSDFDEDATFMKKEEIIAENQNKMFEDTYADWAKQYEVGVSTSLWDQIEFAK